MRLLDRLQLQRDTKDVSLLEESVPMHWLILDKMRSSVVIRSQRNEPLLLTHSQSRWSESVRARVGYLFFMNEA